MTPPTVVPSGSNACVPNRMRTTRARARARAAHLPRDRISLKSPDTGLCFFYSVLPSPLTARVSQLSSRQTCSNWHPCIRSLSSQAETRSNGSTPQVRLGHLVTKRYHYIATGRHPAARNQLPNTRTPASSRDISHLV